MTNRGGDERTKENLSCQWWEREVEYVKSGGRTLPTEGAILGGGATSFSRSSLAILWWSVPMWGRTNFEGC